MDDDLKKALEALGMTQAEAIAAQQKAHREFTETLNAENKKRDAVNDEKLAKLQEELNKFEPLSKALVAAQAKLDQAAEERKEQQEQLDRIETKLNRPGAPTGGEGDPQAAAKRAAFFDWVRFDLARMQPERRNVLTLSDDTGGGYLSTPDYVREIIKAAVEFSPIRDVARIRTTSKTSMQLPARTGTVSGGWVGEVEARSESTGPTYGLHDVAAHEMWAECYVSMANLEDSDFDIEAELRMDISETFGVIEGTGFVSGTGPKKPEGFLTASGTGSVNSGHATLITADGIIDLKHAVKTAYARRGSFLLNRNSLGAVRKLKDGNGQYLWMPGLSMGKPNTIDGDPYVEVPDMPNQGAGTKPMAYGDWMRAYSIVDRLAMAMTRDPLTRASQGQVKFIARKRVGGAVTLAEAIAIMTVAA